MTQYVALVDGERGAYGATVPDLPGCTSAAATIDELRRDVIEAVRLWIEDAAAEGEDLPRARSLEELRQDPEVAAALAQGAALTLVPVVRDYGRLKKANISLDAGLLEAIDAAADERGLTRSSFLATAAQEKIRGDKLPSTLEERFEKVKRSLGSLPLKQSKALEHTFAQVASNLKAGLGGELHYGYAKKKVAGKRKRVPSRRKGARVKRHRAKA